MDPVFGARPMKRHIQRTIETLIARKMIERGNEGDCTMSVDVDENGQYTVKVIEVPEMLS